MIFHARSNRGRHHERVDDARSVLLPHPDQPTLADLTPALLTAQGVPGLTNRLAVPPARTVCLLLIDGLGWRLLREHADRAPFLTEALDDAAPLTARSNSRSR